MGWDSNPRRTCALAGFQVRCIRPLCHPSSAVQLLLPLNSPAAAAYYQLAKRRPPAKVGTGFGFCYSNALRRPLRPLMERTMDSKFEPVMSGGRTTPTAMPPAAIPIAVDSSRVLRNTYWLLALSLLPTIAGAFAGMQLNFIAAFRTSPIMTPLLMLAV